MKNFTLYRPSTPEQAVGLLGKAWGPVELLAGGTDLLDLQKEHIAEPDKVVSLSALGQALRQDKLTWPPGTQPPPVTLGAGLTLAEIAAHKELKRAYPALTTAAGMIAGPQIRNMGTLGGNLCQRNRCWYFRDEPTRCLLKGGDKCFALTGENRYHAVFATGHKCVIVHPSTLAPVLIALNATAEVLGPKGKRTVELTKFFSAPSKAGEREHTLAPDELLLSVSFAGRVPGQVWRFGTASYEVRQKLSSDWPLVQAVAAVPHRDGKVQDVRIVLGHVAPTPVVCDKAAAQLDGKEITEETATAAGRACVEGAKPLAQNEYKVRLIEVAVKRALLLAAGKKPYWEA
jgi:xanthine dehydrogenase YagS FAD-binding subunit